MNKNGRDDDSDGTECVSKNVEEYTFHIFVSMAMTVMMVMIMLVVMLFVILVVMMIMMLMTMFMRMRTRVRDVYGRRCRSRNSQG